MKKKIRIFAIIIGIFAISATTTIGYVTTSAEKKYSDIMVSRYKFKLKQDSKVKNNLCNLTGWNVQAALFPLDTVVTHEKLKKRDENYQNWVKGVALSQRKNIIGWLTEEKITGFLKMVNNSAIEQGFTKSGRDSIFKDLLNLTIYYKNNLEKLQLATPTQRNAIFSNVAKISPRSKAHSLQSSVGGWEDEYSEELVVSFKKLRSDLKQIGINTKDTCADFYGYKFTRYSKQYDYLFSILRWGTYLDKGTITNESITGWKEKTIKYLIDDGVNLTRKLQNTLKKHRVK